MNKILLTLTLIVFTSSAHALNWKVFEDPAGNLKTCLLENLNSNLLSKLSNGRPDKKGMRKKAKRAYQACLKFMDKGINKKISPKDSIIGKKIIKSYLGTAPLYQLVEPKNSMNLIFFNGGPGWWGNLNSKNFLIRERMGFFEKGANIFLFPNSAKKQKMSYDDRLGDEHINKIHKLVNEIRTINNLPIFLVGISRGAVSVGSYIAEYGKEVDGAILMSAIYFNSRITKRNSYSMQEVIGTKPETKILIIHHDSDGCKICQPSSAQDFYDNIEGKEKTLLWVSGGQSTGDPHGPFHHHGYEGVENKAINHLINWVKNIK
jgi:predicted esterase